MRSVKEYGTPIWVIGNPIEHTLSPRLHNVAFDEVKLPFRYFALEVEEAELNSFLTILRQLDSPGGNITLPHKESICSLIQNKTDSVKKLGAANTIYRRTGELCLANTDIHGFKKLIEPWQQMAREENVLLLGAGGAARASLYSLGQLGVKNIYLWNRTKEKAQKLREEFLELNISLLSDKQLQGGEVNFQIVINATSLGLNPGDDSPFPKARVNSKMVGIDLIYNRKTKFVRIFEEHGAAARGGLRMLVYQAARAWELWTDSKPPVKTMLEAGKNYLGL